MVRILHILGSLCPSGAETMLKVAAGHWDTESEHYLLATNKSLGAYAQKLKESGYTVHHIYSELFMQQHLSVIKFIKKNKFDVVHIHREGQALYYEIDAKIGGVKKVIRTVHGVFAFKGILRLRRIVTRQIGCLLGVRHVAIGESVYNNERRRFFIKCIIINNWFDERKFTYTDRAQKSMVRKQLGIPKDIFCMVSVGNCSHVKNHIAILNAIKRLSNFDRVLYLHVGEGASNDAELEFIKKNNLEKWVRYVGIDDPLKYLQASDLYLMPSFHEGLGIAALEAMAIGMPCLFTNVSGLRDFAKYNFANIKYCELNDEAIAKAIQEAIQQGAIDNSEKQSIYVKRLYGIEQGVMGYQRIYYM